MIFSKGGIDRCWRFGESFFLLIFLEVKDEDEVYIVISLYFVGIRISGGGGRE